MQDPAFATALRRLGQEPIILPCGLTLLNRRIAGVPMLMLPRAVPPHDLAQQLQSIGLHRRPLLLSPPHPCKLPPSICLARPVQYAVLPIANTPEERRAHLHQKWRNQLARSENTGLKIIRCRPIPQRMQNLTSAETAQARARRYANWPAALTNALAQAAPEQTFLYEARRGQEVVAHMLFFSHGDGATYHIGHTTQAGRACHAHNALLWRAAQDLSERGCASIDLGLLHDAVPGLNRFKLRTGAHVSHTGGTYLRWRPFARA